MKLKLLRKKNDHLYSHTAMVYGERYMAKAEFYWYSTEKSLSVNLPKHKIDLQNSLFLLTLIPRHVHAFYVLSCQWRRRRILNFHVLILSLVKRVYTHTLHQARQTNVARHTRINSTSRLYNIVKYVYLPRKYFMRKIYFEIDANLFNLLIDFMFAILSLS